MRETGGECCIDDSRIVGEEEESEREKERTKKMDEVIVNEKGLIEKIGRVEKEK